MTSYKCLVNHTNFTVPTESVTTWCLSLQKKTQNLQELLADARVRKEIKETLKWSNLKWFRFSFLRKRKRNCSRNFGGNKGWIRSFKKWKQQLKKSKFTITRSTRQLRKTNMITWKMNVMAYNVNVIIWKNERDWLQNKLKHTKFNLKEAKGDNNSLMNTMNNMKKIETVRD